MDIPTTTALPQLCSLLTMGALFHGNPKKTMVSMSTSDSEYISLASAVQHAQVVNLLCIEIILLPDQPVTVKTDNLALLTKLTKAYGTKRRKFIDLRHKMIQAMMHDNHIVLRHVPATAQKADALTKPLQRVTFNANVNHLI